MNGFEIFLPFKVYAEYVELTKKATKGRDWVSWLNWARDHKIVVKWPCKDRDGNDLDPAKVEDWDRLSTGSVSHLVQAVADHVSGADAAAKN